MSAFWHFSSCFTKIRRNIHFYKTESVYLNYVTFRDSGLEKWLNLL
jgi:hypothetical protein